ncbi:MAG: FG-GAP repeat domain-containing protein [Candidatus Acidiferrales bacterium]
MKTAFLIITLATALLAALAVAALRLPSGTPAAGGFNRIVIPVGKGPGSIAIADVNHDGKPDIIVSNTADETFSVLLGDGNGHFTPAPGSPFPSGKGPNDIAVADMNGDGDADLVIANTGTPYLTVLLGDGKGGFKPSSHSPFATASYPHVHGVAVADFMGDGKLAAITDSWGHNQILLIPGDGKGNLILPGKSFPTGKRPYERLRSADFNRDGKPDVVTTDLDINAVTILLGDGRGGFREASGSPFPAGVFPWGVAVDDMNYDGNLDLVVIPYDRDITDPKQLGVTVLLDDGKGYFTTMHGSPFSLVGCHGPDRVATGDLNGDGFRDIVVSCAQNNKLMLYMGSKDGSFRISTQNVQTGWSGLAVTDLNGDGKDDIIVSNTVQENESQPAFGTITIFFSK